MRKLVIQIIGLLNEIIISWFAPILGIALFSSITSIIIAINKFAGSIVILGVLVIITIYYSLKKGAIWQAILLEVLFGTYGLLALISPEWAILWGLILNIISLMILYIVPGVILPPVRKFINTALIGSIILHCIMAAAVNIGGSIFLIIIGLLSLLIGSLIFSQSARPWEIRRAQRRFVRIIATIGIIAVVVGLGWPLFRNLYVPTPLINLWSGISYLTETWSLEKQKILIGEQAKTNALEKLSNDLENAHRQRWSQNINKIPSVPITQEELEDLGIPPNS